jgi:YD repeat-containing protein
LRGGLGVSARRRSALWHQNTYDGWGNIATAWQSHAGAAVTSGQNESPHVHYAYADGGEGQGDDAAEYVRLTSVTYPDGRVVYYNYPATGVGAALSRLDNIASCAEPDEEDMYAQYTYLGVGTIVAVSHPAVDGGLVLDYDFDPQNPHTYPGWDRFGRVIDQRWTNTAETTDIDRFQYTYDINSNRVSRDVTATGAPTNLDEYYTYDGLDRLASFKRGTLSRGEITHANSTFEQDWNTEETGTRLDSLGNWQAFLQDTDGNGENQAQDQTREHDAANQTGEISGDLDWVDPAYDAAGNMTSGPKPGAETTRLHFKYDAWNRLVKVTDDSETPVTIAEYQYDGQGRRASPPAEWVARRYRCQGARMG